MFILNLTGVLKLQTNYPVVLDGVSIDKKPSKIASLSPGMTENILSITNDYLLFSAISDYCDFPEEKILQINDFSEIISSTEKLSKTIRCGSFQNPHIKKILSLKPDIIITYGSFTQTSYKQLQTLDSVIIQMKNSTTVSDFLLGYKTLCKIFLGNDNFEQFYNSYKLDFEKSLNNLLNKTNGLDELKKTYACLINLSGAVCTGDSFLSDLLNQVNLTNVAKDSTNFIFSFEDIIKSNPYYIIINETITDEEILSSPLAQLDAVKSQRIIRINYSLIEKQSYKLYTIYDNIKL